MRAVHHSIEAAGNAQPQSRDWTQVRPLEEEIASAAIQSCAAAASALGIAYLVAQAAPRHDVPALAALVVYGASMCLAFLTSALYHGVQQPRIRSVLQQIDHCTIFLLIAGTYTPIAVLPLRHHGGLALLAAIWIIAVAGIALRLTNGALYERVAIPLYLAMGWMGLAWSVPLYRAIGHVPILLMLGGGLTYTGGLLLYRWHRLPFSNCLWHLSVVAGSAWFFAAIDRLP
jgi:hemolysin III